ncbi:ion transporter [Salipaludibacillus neizhouensis]|uniref:Ion transporter n=1 Tax=Salipaludibacillus neizhouensis TaxID=885475 RepID=A0A3A9K6J3_9BACI|nr:potassium channel family protein [Salipaludibacillus neizhouensis]RKL66122.1 ion transporter [Salipaludibacillus neizhouensis]
MDILFFSVIIITALLGIFGSVVLLIRHQPEGGRRISFQHFIMLLAVYATVMLGFGILYMSLELLGVPLLREGKDIQTESYLHLIEDVLYFSAVTLLTVGYGDIIPQGIGRWIAIIQALIGYLLPAAFVITTVVHYDKSKEKRADRL